MRGECDRVEYFEAEEQEKVVVSFFVDTQVVASAWRRGRGRGCRAAEGDDRK